MSTRRPAKIITFYSYKGGTGRSMALANAAWLLAMAGNRVLTVDWDLEAPGLHRYFEPFLDDRTLEHSTGVIDFVLEFATAAVTASEVTRERDWFLPYSNILLHAMPVRYDFPREGVLHFVPAGRQDSAYAVRVNSFDWERFYEKLGGGVMLESMRQLAREHYDYILIDSRTGVSDTSGVCTVQLPDELVICFTLNRQSIYGAAAAASSAVEQRTTAEGHQTLKVWPVPMRVEFAEKDRLERARALTRTRFSSCFSHLGPDATDVYWGSAEIPYQPYYSYEEILAVFRDRPRETHSLLSGLELLTSRLTGNAPPAEPMDEERRRRGQLAFHGRTSTTCLQDMELISQEYEQIRANMQPGTARTMLMTNLVARSQLLAPSEQTGQIAQQLFDRGTDGARITGLALARNEPQRGHVEMVLEGVGKSRSAFEQYHALRLCESIIGHFDATARERVLACIRGQLNQTITPADPSRWVLAHQILGSTPTPFASGWRTEPEKITQHLQDASVVMLEVRPSNPTITYQDVSEQHGPFLTSLESHYIALPRTFRIAQCLVSNRLFQWFVSDGGYERDQFWEMPGARKSFLTQDGKSRGPAMWLNAGTVPEGKLDHPVTGISMLEARAFVRWCQSVSPSEPWTWMLPTDELWEYSARGDAGLIYPWGDAFDAARCNSAESSINGTSEVTRYAEGASPFGVYDMAGNLWEFVERPNAGRDVCSLRGGSFKNNRYEVRSYLRLSQVPVFHRPLDFGFRLTQILSPHVQVK